MDECAPRRIVVGGIALARSADVEIVVPEQPDVPLPAAQVLYLHAPQVDIQAAVHAIVAGKRYSHLAVYEAYVRYQRIVLVPKRTLPAVVRDPGEPPIDPDSKSPRVAERVIVLSEVWIVQFAKVLMAVECDGQAAVADREIARHRDPFEGGPAFGRTRKGCQFRRRKGES